MYLTYVYIVHYFEYVKFITSKWNTVLQVVKTCCTVLHFKVQCIEGNAFFLSIKDISNGITVSPVTYIVQCCRKERAETFHYYRIPPSIPPQIKISTPTMIHEGLQVGG
jgi:hypothetical protein